MHKDKRKPRKGIWANRKPILKKIKLQIWQWRRPVKGLDDSLCLLMSCSLGFFSSNDTSRNDLLHVSASHLVPYDT